MAGMQAMRRPFSLAILGSLMFLYSSPVVAGELPAEEVACVAPDWQALPADCRVRTFEYTMRGMVRLLLFWVGKSGVGGGTIRLLEGCPETGGGVLRGVELLFGSRPEAVPGGHNRWGIGRESGLWTEHEGRLLPRWTLFEGFMSKSDEGSLDEVEGAAEAGPGVRLFEATQSCVTTESAACRIFRFTAPSQATYASGEEVVTAYCRRLAEAPDIERSTPRAGAAFGFLSALQYFVDRALETSKGSSSRRALEGDEVAYAYNARPYTLRCKQLRLRDRLELESGAEFREVLELEFETRNGETGARHSFALVIGTQGEFRGVPLRIEDKPRWWLKVRLELMRSDAGTPGAGAGPGISLVCPRPPAVPPER
ncbi:MAG: hypothetical protein Kow00109_25720 [Acidobacteriota bacterium]